MQHGINVQFFICLVWFCQLSCHYRQVTRSNLYIRACVSASCVGSILSDGKLRVHCTKLKHRSTEAQAGVKPISNPKLLLFEVWLRKHVVALELILHY